MCCENRLLRWSASTTRSSSRIEPSTLQTDLAHYAGRVFDAEEMCNLVDASLDFFLTANRYAEKFEADFADYLGVSNALLVNSGSSANLVALTTLTSPKLGERRLKPGDEVVTVAAAFPTTVAPILQNNLVPVFVDVNLGDYTADPDQLREAIGPRTRAIMMAHTLGVPFDLDVVADLAKKHDLWVIEDNCDALGSRYRGPVDRHVRSPGHHVLLSRASHHHGRRRLRGDQRRSAGAHRPVVPRLGSRLLLRGWREQHLRHAVQPAVRDAAARFRSQVRLQPYRLQPES